MTTPPKYSLADIKDMLLDRVDQVVASYAPPAKGSHTTFGKYFTLNPGRHDNSVGSFYVQMTGAKAGTWVDHATAEFGDILDLIALSCNTDTKGALREARASLGLADLSKGEQKRRKAQAAAAAIRRKEAEALDAEKAENRQAQALAIWLDAQPIIKGTPVEFYLRDQRGIDLTRLGRAPGAIRYAPTCKYFHTDQDTGEVFDGVFPAMVAIVTGAAGKPVALHRTYLGKNADGVWDKADLPKTKKVLGSYAGAWITIWKGAPGPRGGKPASLIHAPKGTRVYVTEGIEDALSTAILLPEARVIAAISLSNLGQLALPENVSDVTLVADLDENQTARDALRRAEQAHLRAGRGVRIWQNRAGGKDLNDALRSAQELENLG